MKILLDTHVFLWIVQGDQRISRAAAKAFLDLNNEVFFSAASYWEICLKISLKKLRLTANWSEVIQKKMDKDRILWLPIQKKHMEAIIRLTWIHRDPFDRLLVAQAMSEELAIVTADQHIREYDVPVVW